MDESTPPREQAGAPMTPGHEMEQAHDGFPHGVGCCCSICDNSRVIGNAAFREARSNGLDSITSMEYGYQAVAQAAIEAFKRSEEMAMLLNEASRAGAEAALENDPVRKAAQALVERLDFIHRDQHYLSVWMSYQIHGGDYSNGPKYDKELDDLRAYLSGGAVPALRSAEGTTKKEE